MMGYVIGGHIKIIEANTLKETGADSSGAKSEAEAPYKLTDALLPPADHVTER